MLAVVEHELGRLRRGAHARLRVRMEMEVDGEGHVPGKAHDALGGGEPVAALEPRARGIERERARVDEAEGLDIAVVGRLELDGRPRLAAPRR